MSLTDAREQQLTALIGRVEELEKKSVDLTPYSLLSYVDKLFPLTSTELRRKNDVVLSNTDPSLIIVDSSGIERTVTLPGASSGNRFFIIVNNSDV